MSDIYNDIRFILYVIAYFSRVNVSIGRLSFPLNLACVVREVLNRDQDPMPYLFAPDHGERKPHKVLKTLSSGMVYGVPVSTGR